MPTHILFSHLGKKIIFTRDSDAVINHWHPGTSLNMVTPRDGSREDIATEIVDPLSSLSLPRRQSQT